MNEVEKKEGMDLDLLIMVLILVVLMVFDKGGLSQNVVGDNVSVQEQEVAIVEVAEENEEFIDEIEILNDNLAANKDKSNIYIYSIGEIVDMQIDKETIHFVVVDVTEEFTYLKELGVKEGREVVINSTKN